MKTCVGIAAVVVCAVTLTFCVSVQGSHPAYLHALDNLGAARWMIEHRPGDWVRTVYEVDAVRQIEWAMYEIRKAAVNDGKNLDWHPAVNERPDHTGRLHEALQFLQKARSDVAQDEDNMFARGLRNRAIAAIDGAAQATQRALID